MPRDNSIKKTLVIGSGPIVIGQAAEFDYSGTQACETLKKNGVETVLVNSNPATIMTDKGVADKIYIEPITISFIEKIIEKERPDSLIAGMGGQTGLNMTLELDKRGILKKYGIKIIGTDIEAIKKGEDRDIFRNTMKEIGEPIIDSEIATSLEEGKELANKIGYPLVVRPAYTLGGTGGGFAYDEEELVEVLSHGLSLSPVNECLLEKSIRGWLEIEFEVIRDSAGKKVIVCDMENVDPVGVHTGDSIVVAPCQSLDKDVLAKLKKSALNIVESVNVVGACNVQLALNPETLDYAIIEINPRVSRSSALASKATGYPIARIATKIALGLNLNEIKNETTGETIESYEPKCNYVVVKIPKWPFDKFKFANRKLGTKMMATGEIMSIGSSFEEALLKGIRSLEISKFSLESKFSEERTTEELKKRIKFPDDERLFDVAEIIRRGLSIEMIHDITGIDLYFLEKIERIVHEEEKLKNLSLDTITPEELAKLKKLGFSDKTIASALEVDIDEVVDLRQKNNILPNYRRVDTSPFRKNGAYYYSTYEKTDENIISDNKKIIVIGSGPIRIGQGIEFDYCSVHAIKALINMGIETITINNNPETVSTDFDTSDKLYFEPLTEEEVKSIIDTEKPMGVILAFGGQTAIKLAKYLHDQKVNIFGTDFEDIDRAEDREKFDEMLEELKINRPKGHGVFTIKEGLDAAKELGYPLLVRPSYVLGGQGMQITYDENSLVNYLKDAFERDSINPVLIDKYLVGREIEVDAISDGEDVLIPGIMEHLERAGVHSGDSITIYPSINISSKIKDKILDYTKKIAKALHVKGMINIQFIEYKNELYIIEVNPRASRTVPYISKVSGVPIVDLATKTMLGEKLADLSYGTGIYKEPELMAVKVPVFSMSKLNRVEISLGPEMKSTGEVLGLGKDIDEALFKGFLAGGSAIEDKASRVLATVNDNDKEEFLGIAKAMVDMGYKLVATKGTCKFLKEAGIEAKEVGKINDPRPNILDVIRNGEIDLVVNTPTKGGDSTRDGFKIRRMATEYGIDIVTSLDTLAARVAVKNKKFHEENMDIYNITEF